MTLLEYVKKIPGHRNSKGEPAPWTIVSHETGKVISSHKTKEEAEKHLQRMHYFKEDVNMNKARKVCHDGDCWYEVDVNPNVEESVVIDCIKCGDTYVFNGVNEAEVENRSRPIQDILSNMDPSYREMFISGICPKCWNKMFGEDEMEESRHHCGHILKEDVDKKYTVTNEAPYEGVKVLFTTDDYDEAVELIKKYAKERQGTFIVRDAKTGKKLAEEWNKYTLWSITHDNS